MGHLGDLEVFSRVIALGSMTLAGRELGLSPAVISKRIKRLEERLGVRLLQRTTRQISLTEAGQGFYERVATLLSGLEEAEAYASGRSTKVSGTLRVSAPTSFARVHIAPHLRAFMEAHPQLSLNLSLSDDLVDLIGGGFDVAIRIAIPRDSSLVARKLAPVRRLLCATPGYLQCHGVPQCLDDLKRHQCIPPHNQESWRLIGPQGPVSFKPEAMLHTNSSEVVRAAVLSGLGIGLRSTWDVGEDLKSGRLVQVLPDYEGPKDLCLSAVYPSRRFLAAKIRLFIDYLAELYGPEPYWDL
ncbi:LysR family transcriptional regulator [Allorhizobium undicola]|uniref:LysR family transcriptional regulator n=1 Tax=Allorhizobium undicola TaxID=78527 RepID=UPI003D345235